MDEQLNKIRRDAKSAIRLRGITGIEHTKEGRMQISSNENRGVACK